MSNATARNLLSFSVPWQVPATHPCLAGHFPGRPIVPAVLLLEAVATALRERLGSIRIAGVTSAKFSAPVLPDVLITLHIDADVPGGRARFRCEAEGRLATQGEIGFVPASAAA